MNVILIDHKKEWDDFLLRMSEQREKIDGHQHLENVLNVLATDKEGLSDFCVTVTSAAEREKHGDDHLRLQAQHKLFLVGLHLKNLGGIGLNNAWKCIAVFVSEEKAAERCTSERHFYVPVYINAENKDGYTLLKEAVYPIKYKGKQ